jgi:hypothetical protein
MQPLHLRPHLQVRHRGEGLQLWSVVQMRHCLRLQELIATRRRITSPFCDARPGFSGLNAPPQRFDS